MTVEETYETEMLDLQHYQVIIDSWKNICFFIITKLHFKRNLKKEIELDECLKIKFDCNVYEIMNHNSIGKSFDEMLVLIQNAIDACPVY